jgi:hypothetical protein
MGEHIRSGKLSRSCSFEYQTADRRFSVYSRREHERQKIRQHNPADNMSRGGEGRIPGHRAS